MKTIFITALVILLTGCGTLYRLEEQADGTFKKIPICNTQTFFVDLSVNEEDTTIMNNAVFTLQDGTKVEAKQAVISKKRMYETKGRGMAYAKSLGQIAQGVADTAMP